MFVTSIDPDIFFSVHLHTLTHSLYEAKLKNPSKNLMDITSVGDCPMKLTSKVITAIEWQSNSSFNLFVRRSQTSTCFSNVSESDSDNWAEENSYECKYGVCFEVSNGWIYYWLSSVLTADISPVYYQTEIYIEKYFCTCNYGSVSCVQYYLNDSY